jgi:phenylalanyl-tRNA synthetase alpha subunit
VALREAEGHLHMSANHPWRDMEDKYLLENQRTSKKKFLMYLSVDLLHHLLHRRHSPPGTLKMWTFTENLHSRN